MLNNQQFSEMTTEQLQKAYASTVRRVNNLETRYGGVIAENNSGDKMLRPSDRWWTKKSKILNERKAISDELGRRDG